MGAVSPDPKDAGSILPDLEAVGSISPDPLGEGSVSADPKDTVPSRPTGTHTAANHSRSKHMGLDQNSDAMKEASMPRCNLWP